MYLMTPSEYRHHRRSTPRMVSMSPETASRIVPALLDRARKSSERYPDNAVVLLLEVARPMAVLSDVGHYADLDETDPWVDFVDTMVCRCIVKFLRCDRFADRTMEMLKIRFGNNTKFDWLIERATHDAMFDGVDVD